MEARVSLTSWCDLLFICLICVFGMGVSSPTNLEMTTGCSFKIYNPNEYQSYRITWDGVDPGWFGCEMSFSGTDKSNYRKKYKVCVDVETFYFQSSGIRLIYDIGTYSSVKTTYTSRPGRYCAPEEKYVGIKVEADRDGTSTPSRRIDTTRSYFSLLVTATVTREEEAFSTSTGTIVGAVVGSLLAWTFIIVIICVCAKKHRANSSRSARYTNTGTIIVTDQERERQRSQPYSQWTDSRGQRGVSETHPMHYAYPTQVIQPGHSPRLSDRYLGPTQDTRHSPRSLGRHSPIVGGVESNHSPRSSRRSHGRGPNEDYVRPTTYGGEGRAYPESGVSPTAPPQPSDTEMPPPSYQEAMHNSR